MHLLLAATLQLTLLSSSAMAQRIRVCGTPELSVSAAKVVQQVLNDTMAAMVGTTNQTLAGQRLAALAASPDSPNANARTAAVAAAKPATGINVKVYFHVLRSGTAVSQGNVPDSQIAKQIQVSKWEGPVPQAVWLQHASCHTPSCVHRPRLGRSAMSW
jgi:hypothetical protein